MFRFWKRSRLRVVIALVEIYTELDRTWYVTAAWMVVDISAPRPPCGCHENRGGWFRGLCPARPQRKAIQAAGAVRVQRCDAARVGAHRNLPRKERLSIQAGLQPTAKGERTPPSPTPQIPCHSALVLVFFCFHKSQEPDVS